MESQREVVDWLMSPATHGGARVDRIDTHSAMVFLAGARALKIKRAVRFDYLDFSTPDLRRAACEAEVRINQRAAPAIYRGVIAITREADGRLTMNGNGPAVEWLVDMVRFGQDLLLDGLAERGALDLALMRPLASAIAAFHAGAERRADHGGAAGMAWVIEGNADGFAEEGRGILDAHACATLTDLAHRELNRHGRLLDARRDTGFVRQCHGDLHLRNIVLLESGPTLFDAIEFNDEIACVDVLYDLAFLLMDLWRRGLLRHANAVFNAYLAETRDFDGLPLLPLFLSCRAAVRAKTSATAARVQNDARRRAELEAAGRDYLRMATDLLRPTAPRLIAIGGLSGSGKSTVAQLLAPSVGRVPGALVLRSDDIRKQLCGVAPLDHLGPEGYTDSVDGRVYQTIVERARAAVLAGQSVIADAVFARPADRSAIEGVAASTSVPFVGIWLEAPEAILVKRVSERHLDASDADVSVVQLQLQQDSGPVSWTRVDATRAPYAVAAGIDREAAISVEATPMPTHGRSR